MKVFKRVLIKVLILLLVICVAGGGAASYQAYRQSTPGYAMEHYLSLLIDNSADRAFTYLDQSEDGEMTQEEYNSALEAKRYSLYASYDVDELETRRDNNGNEYVDYKVTFKNAADETEAEEEFTVKKQSQRMLGVFDRWKVLSGHCMVKDFVLTVPAGSQVYLDAQEADASWLTQGEVQASFDQYQIPSLIPGNISLVIRHPILESVNGTLDAMAGSADYTDKMALKESAQDECIEMGVNLLKAVYSTAAAEETEDLDEILADCQETAEQLIGSQREEFHSEDSEFRNAAISNFAAQFSDLVFTEEESGAITTEMTFSYHYVVRRDVTTDTEELQEDGTPVQQTETQERSGDSTAVLTMAYYDGAWHVADMEMQVIPQTD